MSGFAPPGAPAYTGRVPPPVKTVIFDLGNVIVPFDIERGYTALQAHCRHSTAEIAALVRASSIVPQLEAGQMSPQDFVRRFSAVLGLDIGFQRFCELWNGIFLPGEIVPPSLLAGLHQRYRLLALSNTNAIHFDTVRRQYPILKHFDDCVLSFEVGVSKPDPRIYEIALTRAGCLPSECFFTDDVPSYVEAAQRAGMEAVRFESVSQLERDLAARGIDWR
jgi:putative hydrolase of the HAD superfamily